jgi:Flp pilus assembly protein TadB
MRLSVEDLERQAHSFARSVRWRNVREYAAAPVVVVVLAWRAVQDFNFLERWGSCLLVVATLVVVGYLWRRGRAPRFDALVETRALLASHRRELERQRDLLRSVGRWYLLPFVPGFVIVLIGRAADHPVVTLVESVGIAAVFVIAWRLNQAAARELQRDIEALGASD